MTDEIERIKKELGERERRRRGEKDRTNSSFIKTTLREMKCKGRSPHHLHYIALRHSISLYLHSFRVLNGAIFLCTYSTIRISGCCFPATSADVRRRVESALFCSEDDDGNYSFHSLLSHDNRKSRRRFILTPPPFGWSVGRDCVGCTGFLSVILSRVWP